MMTVFGIKKAFEEKVTAEEYAALYAHLVGRATSYGSRSGDNNRVKAFATSGGDDAFEFYVPGTGYSIKFVLCSDCKGHSLIIWTAGDWRKRPGLVAEVVLLSEACGLAAYQLELCSEGETTNV